MELQDLRVNYVSFEFSKTGSRHTKVITSKDICNTRSGKYYKEQWIELIQEQIDARGERETYEKLRSFLRETTLWLDTDEKKDFYAMEIYASRLFENEKWAAYKDFQEYVDMNTNPIFKVLDEFEQDEADCCWKCNNDIDEPIYSVTLHLKSGLRIDYEEFISSDDIDSKKEELQEEYEEKFENVTFGEICPYCLSSI